VFAHTPLKEAADADLPASGRLVRLWRSIGGHGVKEWRNEPFDLTQGHESFDFAQDPEALEGPGRMAKDGRS
jgi:hypothetical protein